MTDIQYPKSSFYGATPVGPRFLGQYVHRSVPARQDDTIVTIDYRWVYRPDLLSLDLYGTDEYSMVVPLRNFLEDPVFELTYGRRLYVPSYKHVREIFG